MQLRIQNMETLSSHGNVDGRKVMLGILEAGLEAADPYNNTRKLIRLEKGKLIVGYKDFEPRGTPKSGDEVYDLSKIGNIYFFGAGKGVQRVAKAIEDVLGDRLTGGHVIDKKGFPVILKKIGITLGAHPVPDEDCVRGSEKILEMTKGLREEDLVFTCVGNGNSALLTMPVPGISLEDIRKTTYIMQIERGAPTRDLNPIRNHVDMIKSGRISKYIHPAKMIHIISYGLADYDQLMYRNHWLHTLPDYTTFQLAIQNLKKWNAWDAIPQSVRKHLETADPEYETVKAEDFEKMSFRIFGVMPEHLAMIPSAMKKAEELGFKPVMLMDGLRTEASQAGQVVATIAGTIERRGQPLEPPCALFSTGEMLVTVGSESGIGGRNQEFALAAAQGITGSKNIVIASVDTDGTDGPGSQFVEEFKDIPCLAGGIVDGETAREAKEAGVDIERELKEHNSTLALWKLKSGVVASPNISILDLTIVLITGRSQ